MKKDVLLKVFTLVVASCLISCSNDNQKIQEGDNSVNIKSYSSQIEESKALALPVDEINSIPNNIRINELQQLFFQITYQSKIAYILLKYLRKKHKNRNRCRFVH